MILFLNKIKQTLELNELIVLLASSDKWSERIISQNLDSDVKVSKIIKTRRSREVG